MEYDSPSQQYTDTLHQRLVFDRDTKLGQTADGSGPDYGVLEDHPVVDVSDEFGRVLGLWTLEAEQVKDPDGEFCKLAILDEFAQVGERSLSAVFDILDHVENSLDDRLLEVITSFVA